MIKTGKRWAEIEIIVSKVMKIVGSAKRAEVGRAVLTNEYVFGNKQIDLSSVFIVTL